MKLTPPDDPADDDGWFDDFDDDEIEEDGFDECGMMADGQCTMAGSEWCDWGCPVEKARLRKKSRKPTP